jgi:hypothetical protein
MCALPLCTAIVRPTKSAVIVERRDQVLIGFLSLIARAFSTFLPSGGRRRTDPS